MTPSLVDTKPARLVAFSKFSDPPAVKEAFAAAPTLFNREGELEGIGEFAPATYPNYLPVWDNEKGTKYPPTQPFDHVDRGQNADPCFKDLLPDGIAKVEDLAHNIGAEVHGIQLSKLSEAGKDQLALFVAQKKVVAFRGQDFASLPIQQALDFGQCFGRHHIHPSSGAPKGYPQIHLVHRSANDTTAKDFFQTRTNSITWHSDVSYEHQPPGTTFLYLLDGPRSGGDTIFANMAEAYNRLSPGFQSRLHGLKATHSAHEQAQNSLLRGGVSRRDPIITEHPIVRTHPITGEKALYVNSQFTRSVVGFKREESDYLLKFLYDHIALSQDLQARVKWAPGTVVVWDNRVTSHSAILDWVDGQRRHLARITPQAERPFETPFDHDTICAELTPTAA